MRLSEAFEVVRGDVVAFTGAGGKTSAMVGLGYELHEAGWRVLATTTTRIGEDQLSLMPHVMNWSAGMRAISEALTRHGFVFLMDRIVDGKVYGLDVGQMSHLLDSVDSDVLLIEADGARGLPFKAPFPHEPVIPSETTLAIPVVSMAALDHPLDDAHVYNATAMVERYGFYAGSRVRVPWIAQVLRDEDMGLRGIPKSARVVAFVNRTPDSGYQRARARLLARLALRSPRLQGVALGSVRAADPIVEVQRSVGAIVLAAGQSRRMGQPKVLLPWVNDRPIIEHIVSQLMRSRLDHIAVVTGHHAEEVKRVLKPYEVTIAHNRAYRTGEMLSSLKAGLQAMPAHISAALVVLGDQPRLQPRVIYQVLMAYAEGRGGIVAPSYQHRRGHPILIARRYWREILDLDPDGAPRDVINAHQQDIHYVEVDNDSILRDVDTPSDYMQERDRAGLGRYNMGPQEAEE